MFYKLLGMAVWKAAKIFLRRKYGPTRAPRKPLIGGGLLAVAALGGAALLAQRRRHSSGS